MNYVFLEHFINKMTMDFTMNQIEVNKLIVIINNIYFSVPMTLRPKI